MKKLQVKNSGMRAMNGFFAHLQIWLAQHQSERRGVLFLIVIIMLETNRASWRTTLVIAGLCLMLEGWAMLAISSTKKRGQG